MRIIHISDPAWTMADGTRFGARPACDTRRGGREIGTILQHVAGSKIAVVTGATD